MYADEVKVRPRALRGLPSKMALCALRRNTFFVSKLFLTAAAAISVAPKLILAEFCTDGKCSDEVEKAKLASEAAEKYRPDDSIFSKIIRKEVPADIVYEDEKVGSLNIALYSLKFLQNSLNRFQFKFRKSHIMFSRN